MNQFTFTQEPPKHWHELCSRHGDLFNSLEWQHGLSRGFSTSTLYGWDSDDSIGITIAVFKPGPFRIGYVGFPVGGILGAELLNPGMIDSLKRASFPEAVHCVRIAVSAFANHVDLWLPAKAALETANVRLQEWPRGMSRNLRKVVDKATRSPVRIVEASEASQGSEIFRLYRDTILRDKGSIRYTEMYFRALIELARVHSGLRCLLAVMDDDVGGFVVAACHHGTAYDLHCCVSQDFRRYHASDLLTHESMIWAKEQGMRSYNLMFSPLNKASLVKYKEKWGAVTREHRTYELTLRPMNTMLFKVAVALYEGGSKFLGLMPRPQL